MIPTHATPSPLVQLQHLLDAPAHAVGAAARLLQELAARFAAEGVAIGLESDAITGVRPDVAHAALLTGSGRIATADGRSVPFEMRGAGAGAGAPLDIAFAGSVEDLALAVAHDHARRGLDGTRCGAVLRLALRAPASAREVELAYAPG